MNFFRKIFGSGNKQIPEHTNFKEGDIFYTEKKGIFQIFKLLKIDDHPEIFHVKGFKELNSIPQLDDIDEFKVKIHHFPIDAKGFKRPRLITKSTVSTYDLLGYFEYLRQTNHTTELIKYAKGFYQEGHKLTTKKKHLEAIEKYSKAIELLPNFYEAIDNKAFCFMDLGKYKEAIEGFKHSLKMNPKSLLATFSLGECYFNLKEFQKAKEYFEKSTQIDPNEPKAKEFLNRTLKRINDEE